MRASGEVNDIWDTAVRFMESATVQADGSCRPLEPVSLVLGATDIVTNGKHNAGAGEEKDLVEPSEVASAPAGARQRELAALRAELEEIRAQLADVRGVHAGLRDQLQTHWCAQFSLSEGAVPAEDEDSGADLPEGYLDEPGYAHLPEISELLYFGNQRSPDVGDFDIVVSTCDPRDREGRRQPSLSTHCVPFNDGQGRESREGTAFAKQCAIEGVQIVEAAVRRGKRTLVHCEWGQNRSGLIVCAYAVVCAGWEAKRAIEYVQARNEADRRYYSQYPMHNKVFNQLVEDMEGERQQILEDLRRMASEGVE